jgi:uncharacterized membrane protein
VNSIEVVRWVHLIAAAVWTGGLITLAFLVTAVRNTTDNIEVLRAIARRFGVLSWVAFVIAIITGTWMYTDLGLPWDDFSTKGSLIVVAGGLALFHQITAKRSSPAVRGIIQLLILIVSIGIFGAAVTLV